MRHVAEAAFVYFCVLFIGLGLAKVVRDGFELLGIEPVLGQLVGALLVAFLLLPAAGFAVRTFDIAPTVPQRMGVGVIAVLLMFVVGIIELVFFRRFFEADLARPIENSSTYITLGLLLFAAVLPVFRERHR
ncbi:MAG: hypothetical protein V4820_09735 [Pseudomonadota bacterium]